MSKTRRTFWLDKALSSGIDALCVRHGDITFHVEQALRVYLEGLSKPKKEPAKKKIAVKPDPAETALQELCRKIWSAYKDAYFVRYGTEPVRNAKVNTQVKQLAQRLGDEAIGVAAFYVGINDQWLIKTVHNLDSLLKNCEAYRTQWATGATITTTTARQVDQTQSNANAVQQAIELMNGK